MKIGIKTFDNEKLLDYFKDKVDFFEIMAIQANDYSFLKKYSLPIIIHAEHLGFNINPADKTKIKENIKSIDYAIKLADSINSKKIIIHPGILSDENCSKEQAISLFKDFNDKRFLIENILTIEKGLCSNPIETKDFLKITNKKLCLDINHAICSANYKNINYIKFLNEFIKLNPCHYHLGGDKKDSKTDRHLSFKDSDIDIAKIMSLLPKNAEITIETTRDIKDLEQDIDYLKRIINKLKNNAH